MAGKNAVICINWTWTTHPKTPVPSLHRIIPVFMLHHSCPTKWSNPRAPRGLFAGPPWSGSISKKPTSTSSAHLTLPEVKHYSRSSKSNIRHGQNSHLSYALSRRQTRTQIRSVTRILNRTLLHAALPWMQKCKKNVPHLYRQAPVKMTVKVVLAKPHSTMGWKIHGETPAFPPV